MFPGCHVEKRLALIQAAHQQNPHVYSKVQKRGDDQDQVNGLSKQSTITKVNKQALTVTWRSVFLGWNPFFCTIEAGSPHFIGG